MKSRAPSTLRLLAAAAIAALAAALHGAPASIGGAAAQVDAVAPDGELRLLATVGVNDIDYLKTRGTAFFQAASMPDAIATFTGYVNGLRFSSKSRGIDAMRPFLCFHLLDVANPRDTVRASFIPVADKGVEFIGGLSEDYKSVHRDGAVVIAEDPRDAAFPPQAFVASTANAVVVADDFRAVRWVVERLRDRDLPEANTFDHALRATIEPGTLAILLDAAAASGGIEGAILAGFKAHLESAAKFADDLQSVELGLTPTASGLDMRLDIAARQGTKLGIAMGSMPSPSEPRDVTLPGKTFMLRCDTFPAFFANVPKDTVDWGEQLADAWELFGCRIGLPSTRWFSEFLPMFSGERFEALVSPPGIDGIASVQAYAVRNHAQAAAKLAELVQALRDSAEFNGTVDDDAEEGGNVVHRFRPDASFTHGETPVAKSFDIGSALSRLSRQTTVEATVAGDLLVVSHGPEGSLAALLPAISGHENTGDTFKRAQRLTRSATKGAKFSGASVYAVSGFIRAIARLSPDVKGSAAIARMPDPGDGLGTLMTSERGRIRWNARLGTSELSTLKRIFSMHDSVLQQMILELTLKPLRESGGAAPEGQDPAAPVLDW